MQINTIRCGWVTEDPIYIRYHDKEWGIPELDSIKLFEMLCLEGQQAGLSWLTILKKRENYKKIFFNFKPRKVAKIRSNDIQQYLQDPGIIRHKGKIEAIVNNAKCVVKMEETGEDFSDFVWRFVAGKPVINTWNSHKEVPSETTESIALSRALKQKGFKYVGPTICYAFMQACGLVNDHIATCLCQKQQVSDSN